MASKIVYATDTAGAIRKLENAIARLDATNLDHGFSSSRNDASAWVSFVYKGKKYRFEYSRSKAEYFGIRIPQQKDILVVLVNGIVDLAVFDLATFERIHKDGRHKRIGDRLIHWKKLLQ